MPKVENTPENLYNKMIDVTQFSRTHKVLNRIKKLNPKERELALRIIKDPTHHPKITADEQKILNSIGIKLFTDVAYKRSCSQKIKSILGNIFNHRLASKKLIRPLINAPKFNIPTVTPVTPVTPVQRPKTPVEDQFIARLAKGEPDQRKKAVIFEQAKTTFESHKCANKSKISRLTTAEKAQFSKTNPAWLNQPFNHKNPLKIRNQKGFYDYKPVGNKPNVWVNFANERLGGGAGKSGFAQEEIMVAEFWQLFSLLAKNEDKNKPFWSNIEIRSGTNNTNRVGQGDPEPLFVQDIYRVQEVSKDFYGFKNNAMKNTYGIKDIPINKVQEKVIPLDPPQKASILAVAAPELHTKHPQEQFSRETLIDTCNQLMAAFTLAKQGNNDLIIHSGPLGCGVFNHSTKAVWILHCLVAQHLGIEVVMHAYDRGFDSLWQRLSPKFQNRPLDECINIISTYLLEG